MVFSREAAAADSCGRQPAEKKPKRNPSREAATAISRFAAPENVELQKA
jgi:hypothetical protein